ncbi:MAG: metallophosphoesterase, partial [Cyanobacteria bacterium P01_H01_bin.15]
MYSLLAGPLTVERITVRIRGLPSALRDTKITLLSDLHYDGLRLSEDLLESAIQRSNQEQPDIVVLTGDHVTDDPAPAPALAQHLCQLSSRYGVYACLGNHDVVTPAAKMAVTDALEQANIHVLWNAIAYPWGESLPLVGLADFWSKEFRPQQVLSELTAEVPRIVLSH